MGRYRAERIIIKEFPELTVVFWNNSAIYVFLKSHTRQKKRTCQSFVFHKYLAPLDTYFSAWKPFKRRLLAARAISFAEVCSLAARYGILCKGAVANLDLEGKAIELRHGKWSIKGVGARI